MVRMILIALPLLFLLACVGPRMTWKQASRSCATWANQEVVEGRYTRARQAYAKCMDDMGHFKSFAADRRCGLRCAPKDGI